MRDEREVRANQVMRTPVSCVKGISGMTRGLVKSCSLPLVALTIR